VSRPPGDAVLLLLDSNGLIYRAFFALPPMTTSDGRPTNAVYGFTQMLNKVLADERPTHVIAVFDKGMPVERVERFGAYKAQRAPMPDELRAQFPAVREVLRAYGIPIVEREGQEADDVIASLARRAAHAGARVLVVTGDLDLLQIVSDRVTVLTTKRGITEMARYDPEAVRERYGLEPAQLPDVRGLKGDASDNLPGVPGIGEKTAVRLIQKAGSLDALLQHPEMAETERLRRLLQEYGDQARLCRDLSRVRDDLDVPLDWEAARYVPPANDDLYRLYASFEFKSLLAKLDPPVETPLLSAQPVLSGQHRSYVAATDPPAFRALADELRAMLAAERVALVLKGDELGVSDRAERGTAFPLAALAHEPVRSAFQEVWQRHASLAAYDAKAIARALHERDFSWREFADDAMLGAHLLDPSRSFSDIRDAVHAYLDRAPGEEAASWADATQRLIAVEREELRRREQVRLYEEVEVPLATVLAKMEAEGIRIEPRALDDLREELDAAAERLQRRIYDLAGEEFNIGSPQQLGRILFEKLGIPAGKKGKTGWATGAEVLQGLAREYPICGLVLEWREVVKLKNTYVDVLPQLIDPHDGRIHTIFNQTATATGRLSSTNPNLQNIPVRHELGRRIRKAFVARDDGYLLLSADYSQIELRLMAHLSGDDAMRRAFEAGMDIHDFTARQIFGIPPDGQVTGEQRRMAKSVNFGLFYGMSAFGLAQRLEIPRAQAKEIIDAYFARFPSVRAYIERTLERARETGYVTTILGRRRYMPGLTSSNPAVRAAAEREATNAPLQGSAADLMKLAMVRIDRALAERGLRARMLLQIHDELIFDVPREELAETARLVRDRMEHALELRVPLAVNIEVGPNWYDVEPYHDA
jgi:DNA polymerase-1